MIVRILVWFAWYLLQLPLMIAIASQMDWTDNLLCYILGEAAVNEMSLFKI